MSKIELQVLDPYDPPPIKVTPSGFETFERLTLKQFKKKYPELVKKLKK